MNYQIAQKLVDLIIIVHRQDAELTEMDLFRRALTRILLLFLLDLQQLVHHNDHMKVVEDAVDLQLQLDVLVRVGLVLILGRTLHN